MCEFCGVMKRIYGNSKEETVENLKDLSDYDLEGCLTNSAFKALQGKDDTQDKYIQMHRAFVHVCIDEYMRRHDYPDGKVSLCLDLNNEGALLDSEKPGFPDQLRGKIPPIRVRKHEYAIGIFGSPLVCATLKEYIGNADRIHLDPENTAPEYSQRTLRPDEVGKALEKMLGGKRQDQPRM